MSYSIAALRAKSDAELIAEHDEVAKLTAMGTQYYLDELLRRADERAAQASMRLALASTVLAAVAVVIAVVALVAGR